MIQSWGIQWWEVLLVTSNSLHNPTQTILSSWTGETQALWLPLKLQTASRCFPGDFKSFLGLRLMNYERTSLIHETNSSSRCPLSYIRPMHVAFTHIIRRCCVSARTLLRGCLYFTIVTLPVAGLPDFKGSWSFAQNIRSKVKWDLRKLKGDS